ncbi:MAG: protein translocase subunit SecD, partial [Clostridia bacterium]|nr:protein translocase subunit SecD [Clostridia bacterium]
MKTKRTGKAVFFVVLLLILALTFTAFFGISSYYGDNRIIYTKGANDIRWGIDIKGGVEAVFSPDKKDVDITDEDMDAARTIIETRLVNKNITDYEVFVDNDNHQIIVRFPWAADESDFDAAKAVKELGETAMLTFCEGETNDKVLLTGADVEKAAAGVDERTNKYVVHLKFNDSGKAKFAAATKKLYQKTISIWMDDTLLSAPTVNEVITEGQGTISGEFNAASVTDLANKINAGALPFALTVDDSKLQIISPSLGSNALQVMLIAGSIAFALICLLMILRYRMNGFVASIALLGQLAGSIACIS